jgi:hypothetical protein
LAIAETTIVKGIVARASYCILKRAKRKERKERRRNAVSLVAGGGATAFGREVREAKSFARAGDKNSKMKESGANALNALVERGTTC